MNNEQLLQEVSKPMTKAKVNALASSNSFSLHDLLNLCFYPDRAIAFRAAWLLEYVDVAQVERFLEVWPLFVCRLAEQRNASCQRCFTKILMNFTHSKAKERRRKAFGKLTENEKEQVVEVLFEWLINPKTPVAVQVNCMDVLANLSTQFSWIKEELLAQIHFLMKTGSAAMQSRGKRLLK